MNLRYVAAAGAAVLLLTGCQAQPPGAAAVVDGHSISMEKADAAAEVYCRLTLVSAQQQGVTTVSNSEVRRQAVSDLVLARVADQLAKERDIEVPTSAYTLTAAQRANVTKTVSDLPAKTASTSSRPASVRSPSPRCWASSWRARSSTSRRAPTTSRAPVSRSC